ncbi:MAG: glycosyltransferase, partial [Acidobacteriota bacterium]
PGEPRLLCVAALKPYKGIPVLLEACRRLLDGGLELRCDLVGDGPLRDDVEAMIDELELGGTVRLLGARPQEEVARRMSEASVLVLPSVVAPDGQMEGIPVVLMEAMASGCPVVSSRISGIPELVRDGVDGILTEPGDAAAVAAAVRRILEDPAEAERLAQNARAAVRSRHRLSDTVAGLLRRLEDSATVSDADALADLVAGWERLRGNRVGVRRVRERADSRVLEIMASDGRRVRELVVKSQRSREGESRPPSRRAVREFGFLRRCHRRGLGVPVPLELDEERAAILMGRCRGDSLEKRLRDVRMRIAHEPWHRLAEDLRAAGRWLRAFQRLGPAPASGEVGGEPGPPALDAVLDEAAFRVDLCLREGLLAPDEEAPIDWLDMLRASFHPGSTAPVPSHGDFWPGNVFVGAGGVEVIDFEGAGVGHPWQDTGYFLVHLQLYLDHPLLRRRGGGLMAAFVDGLGGGRLDEAALRFARIVVALELLAREAQRRSGNGDGRSSLGGRQLRCLRRIVRGGRA